MYNQSLRGLLVLILLILIAVSHAFAGRTYNLPKSTGLLTNLPKDFDVNNQQNADFSSYTAGYEKGDLIGYEKGDLIGYEKGDLIGYEKGDLIGYEKGDLIGYEKGDLIGYEFKPQNAANVKSLINLRDSDAGYLFWSGKIAIGNTVGALIPLDLVEIFTLALQNASIPFQSIFNRVEIELYTKDVSDETNLQEATLRMPDVIAFVWKEIARLLLDITKKLGERLNNELFGNGRAARTTDSAIYNSVNSSFRLKEVPQCGTGGWSSVPDMIPENRIPALTTVVHGAQSHGVMTGVTDCKVYYVSEDDPEVYFQLSTSNPFVGSNYADSNHSKGIGVLAVVGGGNNQNVHFYITNYTYDNNESLRLKNTFYITLAFIIGLLCNQINNNNGFY